MTNSIEYYHLHPEKKKLHDKIYREKHKEELNLKAKQNYRENKDKYKKYSRKYYLENKQKIIDKTKSWRRKNPLLVRKYELKWLNKNPNYKKDYQEKNKKIISLKNKKRYKQNREKILDKSRLWYERVKTDSVLREKLNERKRLSYKINPTRRRIEFRIRESRIRANGGSFSKEDWKEILKKYDNKCIYCGTKDNLSIEHIIPISRGGKNEKDNIAPACYTCNVRKLNFK